MRDNSRSPSASNSNEQNDLNLEVLFFSVINNIKGLENKEPVAASSSASNKRNAASLISSFFTSKQPRAINPSRATSSSRDTSPSATDFITRSYSIEYEVFKLMMENLGNIKNGKDIDDNYEALRQLLGYDEKLDKKEGFYESEKLKKCRTVFRALVETLNMKEDENSKLLPEIFEKKIHAQKIEEQIASLHQENVETRTITSLKNNPSFADLGRLYIATVVDDVISPTISKDDKEMILKGPKKLLGDQYKLLASRFIERNFEVFFQSKKIDSLEAKSDKGKKTYETFAKDLSSVMRNIVAVDDEGTIEDNEIIERYSQIALGNLEEVEGKLEVKETGTIAAKIIAKLEVITPLLKTTYEVAAKKKKQSDNQKGGIEPIELSAVEKGKAEKEAEEAAKRFIKREFAFHKKLKELTTKPQPSNTNSSALAAAESPDQQQLIQIDKLATTVLIETNNLYEAEAAKILSKLLKDEVIEEYKDFSPTTLEHYEKLREIVSRIKEDDGRKGLEQSVSQNEEQLFTKLISFVSEMQTDKADSKIPIMEFALIKPSNKKKQDTKEVNQEEANQVVYDTAIERFAKSRLHNLLREELQKFQKIQKRKVSTDEENNKDLKLFSDEEKNKHLRRLRKFLKDYYHENQEGLIRVKFESDLPKDDRNVLELNPDLQKLASENRANYKLLSSKVEELRIKQSVQEEEVEDLTFENVVESMKAFNRFSYDYRPIRDDEDTFYVRPRFVYENLSLIRENNKLKEQLARVGETGNETSIPLISSTVGSESESTQQLLEVSLNRISSIEYVNSSLHGKVGDISDMLDNLIGQNQGILGRLDSLNQVNQSLSGGFSLLSNLNLLLSERITQLNTYFLVAGAHFSDQINLIQTNLRSLNQNTAELNQLNNQEELSKQIRDINTQIQGLRDQLQEPQNQPQQEPAQEPQNRELSGILAAMQQLLALQQEQLERMRQNPAPGVREATLPQPSVPLLPPESNNGINPQIEALAKEIGELRALVGNPGHQEEGRAATGLFAIKQDNNDAIVQGVNQALDSRLQNLQEMLGKPVVEGREAEAAGILAIQQRVDAINGRFEEIQRVLNGGEGEENTGLVDQVKALGVKLTEVQRNLAGAQDFIRAQVNGLGEELRGIIGTPANGDAADPTGVYLALEEQRKELRNQLNDAIGNEGGLGGRIEALRRVVEGLNNLPELVNQRLENLEGQLNNRLDVLQDHLAEVRNGQQNNVNQNPNQNPDGDDLIAAPRIVSKETLQTMPEMSRILFPAIVGGSTGFELTQAGPVAIYKKSELLKLQDHINAATQAYNDNNRQDFVSSTGHNQSSLVSVVKIVDDNQPNQAQYRILSLSKLGLSQTFLTQAEYEKFALDKVTLTNQKTKEAITENLRDGKPVDLRKILEKGVNQNDRLNSNERETQHRLINDAMSKHYEELKQEAEKQVDKSLSERYQSLIDLVQNDDLKRSLNAALNRDDFAKVRSELLDSQQEGVIKESLFSPLDRRQAGNLWSEIAEIRNGKPNNQVRAYDEVEGLIFGGQGDLVDAFKLLGEGKYSEFRDRLNENNASNAKTKLKFAREASKIGVIRSDFGDRFLEKVFAERIFVANTRNHLGLELDENLELRNSLTDLTNKLFKDNSLQTLEEEVRNSGRTENQLREDFELKFYIRYTLSSANTIGDLLNANRALHSYSNGFPEKIAAIKTFFNQIVDESLIANDVDKYSVKSAFSTFLESNPLDYTPIANLDSRLTGTQLNEANKEFLQGEQGVKSLIELPVFGLRDKIKRDLEGGSRLDLKKIIHFLYAKENSDLVNQEVADDLVCEVLHAKKALLGALDELAKPIHLTDDNLGLIATDKDANAQIRNRIKDLVEARSFKDLFDLLNDQLQKPQAERFADEATNENIANFLTALKNSLRENGFINQQQHDDIVFDSVNWGDANDVVNDRALLDFKAICQLLQQDAADLPSKNKKLRDIISNSQIEEDQAFTNARAKEFESGITSVASFLQTLNGAQPNPKQTIASLVSHIFGGDGEDTVERRKHHSLFDPKEGIKLVGEILDQYPIEADLKQGIIRDLTAKEYSRALEKISTISEDIARGDGAIAPDYSKLICDVRTRAMNRLQDGDYTGLYEILFADENKTIVDKEAAAGFFKNIFVKAQEIAKQNVDPANAAQNALANENLAEIRSLEQYFEKIPLITQFIDSHEGEARNNIRSAIQNSVAPNGKKTLGFPVSNGIFESLELRQDIREKLANGQYEEVNQVIDNLRNSRLIAGSGDIIEKKIKIGRSSAVEFMAEFNAHNYPEILAAFKAEKEKVAERIDGYRDLASNRYSQTQIDGIMRLIVQDPNAVGIEPSIAQINEWRNNNSPDQFIEKIFDQNGDPKFPALFHQVEQGGNSVNNHTVQAKGFYDAFRNKAARENYITEALRQRGRQDDLGQLDSLNRAITKIEDYKTNVLKGKGPDLGLPQEYLGNNQEIKDLLRNNENIAKAVTAAVAPKLARIHSDIYQQERIENSASRSNYSLSLSKEEKAAMALGDKSLVSVLNLEMPVVTNNSGFSSRKNLRNQFAVAFHGNFGKIDPQTGRSDGAQFPNDTAYVPVAGTKDYFVRTRVCTASNLKYDNKTNEMFIEVYRNGKIVRETHKVGDVIVDEGAVFRKEPNGEFKDYSLGETNVHKASNVAAKTTNAVANLVIGVASLGLISPDKRFLDARNNLEKEVDKDLLQIIKQGYKDTQVLVGSISKDGERNYSTLSQGTVKNFASIIDPLKAKKSIVSAISSVFVHKKPLLSDVARFSHEDKEMVFTIDEKGRFSGGEEDKNIKINSSKKKENGEHELTTNLDRYSGRSYYHKSASVGLDLLGLDRNGLPAIELLGKVSIIHTKREGGVEKLCENSGDIVASDQIFIKHTVNKKQVITALFNDERTGFNPDLDIREIFGNQISPEELLAKLQKMRLNHVKNSKAAVTVETKAIEFDRTFESNEDGTMWRADLNKAFKAPEKRYKYEAAVSSNNLSQQICRGSDALKEKLVQSYAVACESRNNGMDISADQASELNELKAGAAKFKADTALNEVRRHLLNTKPERKSTATPDPVMRPFSCKTLSGEEVKLRIFKKDVFGRSQ